MWECWGFLFVCLFVFNYILPVRQSGRFLNMKRSKVHLAWVNWSRSFDPLYTHPHQPQFPPPATAPPPLSDRTMKTMHTPNSSPLISVRLQIEWGGYKAIFMDRRFWGGITITQHFHLFTVIRHLIWTLFATLKRFLLWHFLLEFQAAFSFCVIFLTLANALSLRGCS